MASPLPKEWKPLLKALSRSGWEVVITASGHLKAYPPGGGAHVVLSGSAHALKAAKASLRRAGWAG